MAAPSYTEDLTDISLMETGETGVVALNISGGGGGTPAYGIDFKMQGTGCFDKAASNAERAIAVNKTPGAGTVATGVHIFQWGFVATPGVCENLATRGVYLVCGTSATNFMQFHVEGSETIGAVGRVGKCYAYDYVTTSNTGSVPYRTVNGSPGATPTYFGYGLNTNATVKGSNMGMDAVRYGTGGFITAGDSGTPATFDGFSTQNDSETNRWGILTNIGGSYELQGTFAIGQNNGGTATLAYFEDSDVSITLIDTVHSTTDFTKFIIDHASTEVYWTNITITALGTNNPGELTVVNSASVFEVVGGTWTGLGTTDLEAACTVDGLTWRGCGAVTANGATFDSCVFDQSTATDALVIADLDDITTCHFASDGTGHAIDLGTISATASMEWDSTTSGYASSDGTTGDETILVDIDSPYVLTINSVAGATKPTIHKTGTGTVTVLEAQVTIAVTVLDDDTGSAIGTTARVLLYDTADYSTEILNSACSAGGVASTTQSYTADIDVEGWVREMSTTGTDYTPADISGTVTSAGFALTVRLKPID